MISFSRNPRVALCLIRSAIYISTVPIMFLCGGSLGSCSAQEVLLSGRSEAAEFQKLEPALKCLRERNARTYAITTPNGIDEATYVEIGGIEQWITIRGEDRNNPVLLFLHGGPGDATNPWGYAAFRSWLKYFTVVQWDQRGSGRTFGRNGAASASTITPDRMAQDGIELAEWVKKELHKDKIVLVGHSWGSVLGFLMVKARPELFYAFVGTGQVAADFARSSAVAYTALVERASREGNSRALVELKEVGPPPYKDGKGFGVTHFDELDRKLLGGELAIPVFVIQGAEDYTTPVSLARSYVDALHAPRKAFTTIEGAGHFAVFTKQDEFLKELRMRVLPLIR